ncbi:helix-turn-helix domain-containing protein [Bradyrhizobium sp. C-145]|uniref:helix-turn-helix domain-containing protein n=1 Tax=Bradyrhizobium sp. C-145 TaxID=574727 RepID=UPI00201B90F1|nr:helix-turn-helix domain-containing protein [Bradyrhizobium sp. C-145]UQR64593.1 helix-turn-helix domain-containing protein [Bradyrhizobium sp. C-145]
MIDLDTCSDYMLLSTLDVAEALKISPGAVRKAAKEGRLRAIAGFRVLYFPAIAVRAFARGNADAPASNNLKQPDANAEACGEVGTEA